MGAHQRRGRLADGLWARRQHPPKELKYRTLLPREELTLERFANWIPINDTLDGIARVAGRPIEGFLQTEAISTHCAT